LTDIIKNTQSADVYPGKVVKIVSIGVAGKQACELMVDEGVKDVIFLHFESRLEYEAVTDEELAADLMNAHMVVVMGVLDERHVAFFKKVGQISQSHNLLTVGIFVTPSSLNSTNVHSLSIEYGTVIAASADQIAASNQTTVDFLNLACAGLVELFGDKQLNVVDFTEIQHLLSQRGQAAIGIGIGVGSERSTMAANQALAHASLKGMDLKAATGVILILKANSAISSKEMRIASDIVFDSNQGGFSVETTCLCLRVEGGNFDDELRVSVIVTGQLLF